MPEQYCHGIGFNGNKNEKTNTYTADVIDYGGVLNKQVQTYNSQLAVAKLSTGTVAYWAIPVIEFIIE